jgi:hypothetical protein
MKHIELSFFGGLTLASLSMISCKYKDDKISNYNMQQGDYTKVEIYCHCISDYHTDQGNVTMINCTSSGGIRSHELIEPEYFFDSTSDKTTIQALKRIFFERKEAADTITKGYSDARLVFLFRKNKSEADTLVFISDYDFNYNEKFRFTYSFHIMDSLEKIFKKDKIECPSKL